MTKQKKIFAVCAVVFLALLGYASYDISKRTTFPGSKPQLPERLKNANDKADTVEKTQQNP